MLRNRSDISVVQRLSDAKELASIEHIADAAIIKKKYKFVINGLLNEN